MGTTVTVTGGAGAGAGATTAATGADRLAARRRLRALARRTSSRCSAATRATWSKPHTFVINTPNTTTTTTTHLYCLPHMRCFHCLGSLCPPRRSINSCFATRAHALGGQPCLRPHPCSRSRCRGWPRNTLGCCPCRHLDNTNKATEVSCCVVQRTPQRVRTTL